MARFRAYFTTFSPLLLAPLLACAGDDQSGSDTDTSPTSTSSSSTATATASTSTSTTTAASTAADTAAETTAAGPELVDVAHTRELRGVWIATVFNINYPSAPGLDELAQQDELLDLLDTMEQVGLNALFFQVRPECDAFYPSTLDPWSRALSGSQGVDPGWDPLELAIDEAHQRGIELHAWLNPYRARANKNNALDPAHIAALYPQHAHDYGAATWMDPGAEPVQKHLLAVVDDLIRRYPLDGIHFDDYFYPYPEQGLDFPDALTWGAYQQGGGQLSRADWRRANVDHMVQSVAETIASERPDVRFGISPFGIYRPGIPEGITGFDQYEGLFADPLKWIDQGWVDYLAPQLYWPTTYPKQAYDVLVAWWASITTGGRHIFAGNYLSKLGSAPEWSLDQFRAQIELTRAQAEQGARGNIFFHIEPFIGDQYGVASAFRAEFYDTPALTPPIAARAADALEAPTLTLSGGGVALDHPDAAQLRAYVIYRADRGTWSIDQIVPAPTNTPIPLSAGDWAISAAARSGVESPGVVVTVP